MTIEFGVLISLVSLLIGYFGFQRNKDKDLKKDAREEASKLAVIETQLGGISSGINEIRIDMRSNDKTVASMNQTLVRLEESSKSAHKRLDSHELAINNSSSKVSDLNGKVKVMEDKVSGLDEKVNNMMVGVK